MIEVYPAVANKGFSVTSTGSTPSGDAAPQPVQGWMRPGAVKQQILNANELTSLSALIAYVAYQSGATEYRIERQLANQFNVPNAKFLPANQYDSAVRYLVDTFSA
ncbi:MAG: hypothetical protein KGI37_09210 [Alphaproteobacteria bacterium]|nr:hypothetical protein [Alphaproteobacteria bacterium]